MKKKMIAIWACALYFTILFLANAGQGIWGTLGLIRPADTHDGMIEADRASALLQSFAVPLQRLTWLVGLGAVLLLWVAVWFSISGIEQERGQSKKEQERARKEEREEKGGERGQGEKGRKGSGTFV